MFMNTVGQGIRAGTADGFSLLHNVWMGKMNGWRLDDLKAGLSWACAPSTPM